MPLGWLCHTYFSPQKHFFSPAPRKSWKTAMGLTPATSTCYSFVYFSPPWRRKQTYIFCDCCLQADAVPSALMSDHAFLIINLQKCAASNNQSLNFSFQSMSFIISTFSVRGCLSAAQRSWKSESSFISFQREVIISDLMHEYVGFIESSVLRETKELTGIS